MKIELASGLAGQLGPGQSLTFPSVLTLSVQKPRRDTMLAHISLAERTSCHHAGLQGGHLHTETSAAHSFAERPLLRFVGKAWTERHGNLDTMNEYLSQKRCNSTPPTPPLQGNRGEM